MQRLTYAVLSLGVACWTATATADDPPRSIDLLAGNSLEKWECFTIEPGVKCEDVWSLRDGVLVCKGEPLGFLRTKDKFTNFELSLEWRWAPGVQKGNSGVLLRIAGEPISFLPKCVECQLASGSAGDLWAFYGFALQGDESRKREVKDHAKLGNFHGASASAKREKEMGQWNRYDIRLKDGDLTVSVNGEKVNQATACEVLAGPIGLQSEGGEIHFRNIRLDVLP